MGEAPLELVHKLRLHSDDERAQPTMKRPIVSEQYEQLIFYCPRAAFYNRHGAVWHALSAVCMLPSMCTLCAWYAQASVLGTLGA